MGAAVISKVVGLEVTIGIIRGHDCLIHVGPLVHVAKTESEFEP